jgi:hypothetical protein
MARYTTPTIQMHSQNRRLVLSLVCVVFMMAGQSLSAQFKQTYLPDTTTLKNISLFDATGIEVTEIPGQGLAICGSLTGKDSIGDTRQTVFLMQMSELGEPKQLNMFQDTSSFLIFGPRAYGLTYDGSENFYLCVGSNDNQVMLSVKRDGTFRWGQKANHHEFYSAVMDDGEVVFLGQDESVIGVHDYCIAKLDSMGNGGPGNMFGTVDFDIPKNLISVPDGYVMAGYTFFLGAFNAMVIKCDKQFNLMWSRIYSLPNKDLTSDDVAAATDGSGYVFTGRSTDFGTGMDSLYIMKLDTVGNLSWFNLYGIENAQKAQPYGMVADPLGRGYLLCGHFQQPPRFEQPLGFMVDPDGNGLWMRSYGEGDSTTQEILKDIAVKTDGSFFYSVGEVTELTPNNQIEKRMMVIKAGLTDGTTSCDSALNFGARATTPIPGGNAHEEPFFAVSPYGFSDWTGQYNNTVICSVLVQVGIDLEQNNTFSFNNPAMQELILDYIVEQGDGRLRIVDVQGRTVRNFPIQQGEHRRRFSLNGLPQGLYFVTAIGEDWRSETKRLMIVR